MPPGSREYYATLGVPRTASADQIRRAHRKLARRYHPDFNPGDKSAEERFKNIQEAYDVLIDSDSRRMYDQTAFNPETAAAETSAGTMNSAGPHPAADRGSSEPRERMHDEAAGDVGLRDFYAPRSDSKIPAAAEGVMAVIQTSFVLGLLSLGFESVQQRLASFGWGGFRVLEPMAILSAIGFLLGGARGNFLARCALINAAAWLCFLLYCWKAQMLEWPAIMQMLPWVLPTHIPVMVGAYFRRGIASLTS